MSDTEAAPAAPEAPAPPVRRAPRWMKLLLIVSLAVNLLVIGYHAAQFMRGPRFVSAGPAASFADARKLYWAVPRDRRHVLREEFIDRNEADFVQRQRDWRDARDRLADILARPGADSAEIRAAYETLGRLEAEASVRWREVLADMTLRLTDDERARFAHRFSWRRPWRDRW
jgi:uncharacterized membrane protein